MHVAPRIVVHCCPLLTICPICCPRHPHLVILLQRSNITLHTESTIFLSFESNNPHSTNCLRSKICISLKLTRRMYSIREQLLTTCPILASLYMEILHTFSILPQKGLIFPNYVFPQTFTPNLPIFHTDISVISVTFRNSGNDSIQIIVCEQNNELLPLEDAFSSEDKCRQHSYVPEATP